VTASMDLGGPTNWGGRRPVTVSSETLQRLVGSVWKWMAGGTRITDRDVEILEWVGRHGVVTPQQVARRFFVHDGEVAQKRAYRRLAKLEELDLIRRDAPFARHPEVIRLRMPGVTLAEIDLPPARYVVRQIPHELAVVDLVEELLSKNKGATVETGREIRSRLVQERWDGKRRVGRGRIPDAILTLRSGKTVAIELQMRVNRTRDDLTILQSYLQERFDAVWWYAPESGIAAIKELVKARRADDLIDVRPAPESPRPSSITERDREILTWIGRYGIVTSTQVAQKFFSRDGGTTGARAASNRLRFLEGQGLVRRNIPSARHAAVLRITPAGAELADGNVSPAGWVPAEISHSLAVVDLMEQLQAEHPGSSVRTEREIRIGLGIRGRGRSFGTNGRIPDGELILKSGKRVAVELDLTAKRSPDIRKIVRLYERADYSAVWWFVRPGVVARMTDVVREQRASKLVDVHPFEG
jgi:Replication-relaxation